eukprot:jgi/Tetstr1/425853/TSEL_016230.t1
MAGFRPQLPRRAGGRGSVIATLANPAAIIAALVLVAGAVRLTESAPLRAMTPRARPVGLEMAPSEGWPVFEVEIGNDDWLEEGAVEPAAQPPPVHVDDHTPAQSDADQQGPRDLERRYTIQHLAEMEDAAGTEAGKVAKDPVVSAAFVLAESDRNKKRTNDASSIVQVGTGEFLAAWSAGTDENAPDVAIWTARFRTRGGWGPAVETVAPFSRDSSVCGKHLHPPVPCEGHKSIWNPVLMRLPDDELLLFYKTGTQPSKWTGWLMRSKDKGHTWGAPAQLPLPVNGPARHKPIMLPSGVILAGASSASGRAGEKPVWQSWIEYSKDGGRSWERHGSAIPFDGHLSQPALWIGDDMSVNLLAHNAADSSFSHAEPGEQYLIRAHADKTGLQWSSPGEPVLDLPSPGGPGDVVRLSDGRLLVIYNHSKERDALRRSTLALSVSSDGGSSWQVVLQLEDAPPNDITQEYSYPSIIQADDGLVHLTYTYRRRNIRHVVVDPRALKPLEDNSSEERSGEHRHQDTSGPKWKSQRWQSEEL